MLHEFLSLRFIFHRISLCGIPDAEVVKVACSGDARPTSAGTTLKHNLRTREPHGDEDLKDYDLCMRCAYVSACDYMNVRTYARVCVHG